jgi:hypothetical protein
MKEEEEEEEEEGGSCVETDDMIPENPIVVYPPTDGS